MYVFSGADSRLNLSFTCMSSLTIITIIILRFSSTIVVADRPSNCFTQSVYQVWCQENLLSNSLFLYPHRTPIGIRSAKNDTSVTYHLIDDQHFGLFTVRSQRVADFHFLLLNITRPLEINREYQDIYVLHIRAKIVTPNEKTLVEQTEVKRSLLD